MPSLASEATPAGSFGVARATAIIGGTREVALLSDRDAIPSYLRKKGMVVRVHSDGTAANNTDWQYNGADNTADNTAWIDTRGQLNVKWFGAKGDGVTNDTAAITAAIALAGKGVYFPAGTYLCDNLTISAGLILRGAGQNATFIKASATTGDVWSFAAQGWGVHDLAFTCGSNRTSGAYIKAGAGRYADITGIHFEKYYIGADIDGVVGVNLKSIFALNGTPKATADGGCIIRCGNTAYTGSVNISDVIGDTDTPASQVSAGIILGYVDVVTLRSCLIIHHTNNLFTRPGNGQVAALINVTDCCLDTASRGCLISPAVGGKVTRFSMATTWTGSHTNDGVMINGIDGIVDGVTLTQVRSHANGEIGFNCLGANAKNIRLLECYSAQCVGNGLQLTSGCNARAFNCVFGACEDLTGGLSYGIALDSTSTGAAIHCSMPSNTLGAIYNANPSGFVVLGNEPYEWASASCVVVPLSGSITTYAATCNYRQEGKTLLFTLQISIANNGTGAVGLKATLPFTNNLGIHAAAFGNARAVSGRMIKGDIDVNDNHMYIFNYDGTYPAASGEYLVLSGFLQLP